ncbi:hypothetical protein HPB52_017830 [Rhipicephalus sanguineus]|uniref:Uncharacterized protein n=1 Tax=Rhipicephalus sanguineus TaxID=34632 RepID=A0A9D4T451_RHISA|nr:hypothetical protein HPB52_017830 [Rhipicephalus sanguineus]
MEHESVLRANLTDESAINKWLEAYSIHTNTSWIVQKVVKEGERMVFHKVWRCQYHSRNKKTDRRNAGCMASLDIKIKKLARGTKQNDAFLRKEVPLVAVIRIDSRHTHSTQSADALRLLRPTTSTRETFLHYVDDGMTPTEARRLHESKLCLEDNGPQLLASGAMNPQQRTVYYWHSVWRAVSFGGGNIDPLTKLEEKAASVYAAQGTTGLHDG